MRVTIRRLRRLELQFKPAIPRDFLQNPHGRVRLVVARMDRQASLERSTCTRRLSESGFLTEVVRLDGTRAGVTDDELERFVSSFPVVMEGAR
jgi:hypothetical protein